MRILLVVLALLAAVAAPASAQAELFPADTFVYVEADATALEKGIAELQLVKLLGDPKLRRFLQPMIEKLGIDPDKAAETLLQQSRTKRFLAGRFAAGASGLRLVVRPDGEKATRFEVSPEHPVDARMVYAAFGLAARFGGNNNPQKIEVEISGDMLVALEPGPHLRELVKGFLADPPMDLRKERVKIGDREVSHLTLHWPFMGGLSFRMEVYADLSGDRWLLATNRDTLAAALGGGPRSSLANAGRLAPVRAQLTGGLPVLFAYADLATAMKMFRNLFPPILGEANEINGLNALKGVGFGVSIADGGIRESLGIVLDGNPRGVWKILEAMPRGLRSLEVAPPGALAAFSVKFDSTLFLDRARELTAAILPGNEGALEAEIARAAEQAGFDLRKEILPALGDEMAVYLYPIPRGQVMPDVVVGMSTRDPAKLAALVDKLKTRVPAELARFERVKIAEGIEGFQVFARLPVQTTVAIHKGHLFAASRPDLLKDVLTTWGAEGSKSLRKDGDVLPRVLKALNGGRHEDLVVFGYLNLREALMPVMPLVWNQLPKMAVDTRAFPDARALAGHFTGAAIGVRHNANGLTFDFYSPVGVLLPATAAAIIDDIQRRRRWARQRQRVIVAPPRPAASPSLGINMRSSDGTGISILGMFEGAPVAKAGFKSGDRIIAVDGKEVGHIEDLDKVLAGCKVGDEVLLTVMRGTIKISITVALAAEGTFQNR